MNEVLLWIARLMQGAFWSLMFLSLWWCAFGRGKVEETEKPGEVVQGGGGPRFLRPGGVHKDRFEGDW